MPNALREIEGWFSMARNVNMLANDDTACGPLYVVHCVPTRD
jgi:hypothetical protein